MQVICIRLHGKQPEVHLPIFLSLAVVVFSMPLTTSITRLACSLTATAGETILD